MAKVDPTEGVCCFNRFQMAKERRGREGMKEGENLLTL